MTIAKKRKRRKICFLSIQSYPLYNKIYQSQFFGGGAAVQLFILSKEFGKDENYDVNVIVGNYQKVKNKIEIINNLKVYNVRPFSRKITYYFLSLIHIFITLIKINPDVVIQRAASKITGICAFYCKIFKKKFIYSIANLTDVNGKNEKGFFGKMYRFGLNSASFLVAQNKEQIEELEKYKKRKFKNISIIRNSYQIKKTFMEKKEYILWVARAINWKRPELFIKLAKIFPNEKFVMICNKTDDKEHNIRYWNKIHNEASEITNLTFIEFVPYYKVSQYFKEAKIFINTSKFEGFPNTFIQSFINKIPVISLNVNPDNIFLKYKLGYLCNDSFSMMVNRLNEMLRNEKIYKEFSQNCYQFVNQFHDIRKNIELWKFLVEK
ncbi:MAG: glycosyltransferase family 4 protein [Promethearchaeota archaeon]